MKILEERKHTVSEVAKILKCSKSQVRYLLNTGQLRGFKVKKFNDSKGSWRIYESAIIDYVIENDLFHELNIPFNLIENIKLSWENDVHWHIYSRFDFAGGIDGKPVKLIEFNADTPTALFETAIIQWALLKYNGMDEERQFNGVYEAIKDNLKDL